MREPGLDRSGLPPAVRDIILDQLVSGSEDFKLVLSNVGGGGSATAIRNEDLELLDSAATLVVSFLGSAAIAAWAPAAVANLVLLLYRLRKKRIPITALQAAVLRELKTQGSLTVAEITSSLDQPGITDQDVEATLGQLSNIRRADGVKVGLVSPDPDGTWHAEDV
jgi:hypothetical protein